LLLRRHSRPTYRQLSRPLRGIPAPEVKNPQKPLRECLLVHTVFWGCLLPGGHSKAHWTGSRAVPPAPIICLVITGCATIFANVARANGVGRIPRGIPHS